MNTNAKTCFIIMGSILSKSRILLFNNSKVMMIFLMFVLITAKGMSQPAVQPFGEGIQAKVFHSSVVDDNNRIWFLTEAGIVSYDGQKWAIHNKNQKISSAEMKDLAYDLSLKGNGLWLATPEGVALAALPVDPESEVTLYSQGNSTILSNNVTALAVGKGSLKWFGTDKGISAFKDNKWLVNSYDKTYPESMFMESQITSMATSPSGDTVYAGTAGLGVIRVYRNDVDGVSGASEYALWGPIIMPSDNVQSVYIAPDGVQWVGTDLGVAVHTGYETLENWEAYTTDDGLVDNFVQAINSDGKGNMWFGTKNGASLFDGSKWTSYNVENGLPSNNVLSIAIDQNGVVWLGTDNGVSSINNGKIVNYQ
jgi:ligand-binding sensor domain-containing protein